MNLSFHEPETRGMENVKQEMIGSERRWKGSRAGVPSLSRSSQQGAFGHHIFMSKKAQEYG
jgi:hypothetical protein